MIWILGAILTLITLFGLSIGLWLWALLQHDWDY